MSSNSYWKKREEKQKKLYIRQEAEYLRKLDDIYTNMFDEIEKEINGFYMKYASKEGITMAEAKRRVSKLDMEEYSKKAKRYVKTKNFSKKANEQMRIYNLTMKVNRLEMLKAGIGNHLVGGFDDIDQKFGDVFTQRAKEELERQAGILGETVADNSNMAKSIVNASFKNATYSDRVWMHQGMLKAELDKLLQEGLIQGKHPRELARHLEKRFGASKSNAQRLMRTELARVQTEAQKQSFEKNGFTKYEFVAIGSACDICRAIDGKHFDVKKMMPGENAPPMHPNCRCSIAAWEDDDDYEAWLDYLDKGGTTEEWNELKNNSESVAKTDKSGTIKSSNMSNVFTGGKRNEKPLSEDEINRAKEAAKKQGYDGEMMYSDNSNTSFHGSTEGDPFHYLVIGTDAYTSPHNGGTANENISLNGCMAHEVVGHYETWKKGTANPVEVLDEVQASIRASKFGVDLSKEERDLLWRDGMDRLNAAGITFDDVKDSLDIWER